MKDRNEGYSEDRFELYRLLEKGVREATEGKGRPFSDIFNELKDGEEICAEGLHSSKQ